MVYNTLKRVYVQYCIKKTPHEKSARSKNISYEKNRGKTWERDELQKICGNGLGVKTAVIFFFPFSSTAFCTPAVFSTFLFQLNCLKKYISTGMYLCCCPYFLSTFFLKISSKTSYSLKDYLSRTQNCHRFFSVSFKRCSAAAILVGSETVF